MFMPYSRPEHSPPHYVLTIAVAVAVVRFTAAEVYLDTITRVPRRLVGKG